MGIRAGYCNRFQSRTSEHQNRSVGRTPSSSSTTGGAELFRACRSGSSASFSSNRRPFTRRKAGSSCAEGRKAMTSTLLHVPTRARMTASARLARSARHSARSTMPFPRNVAQASRFGSPWTAASAFMAFARAFSSKISMARARTRKGGFGKAPCLLKMCYPRIAEGSPPPGVMSPRGSKGPSA